MTNPPRRQTTLNILLITLAVVVVVVLWIGGDQVATFEVTSKTYYFVEAHELPSWASWLMLVAGLVGVVVFVVLRSRRKKD